MKRTEPNRVHLSGIVVYGQDSDGRICALSDIHIWMSVAEIERLILIYEQEWEKENREKLVLISSNYLNEKIDNEPHSTIWKCNRMVDILPQKHIVKWFSWGEYMILYNDDSVEPYWIEEKPHLKLDGAIICKWKDEKCVAW